MKKYQSTVLASVIFGAASGSLNAAVYFTNFNGYSIGDINGQNGWTSNGATADTGFIQSIGGAPWNGRAATIGFVDPVTPSVPYVSRSISTPLVGGGVPTSFSVLFQIQDSDSGYGPGAEDRDSFGFRLQNGSGANLFSFILTPFAQVAEPENSTNFNTFSWSTGTGAPTVALPGGNAAQENFAYTFTVNFFDLGSGNVGFNADVNGAAFGGTLTGLGSETISSFGAFWDTTTGTASPGSNFMIFDNVSLVPEPSSALLGLLGASCVFLRRRRA